MDYSGNTDSLKNTSDENTTDWSRHPKNPYNWPERRKWTLFWIVVTTTLLFGLNSAAIATPSEQIADTFHVSHGNFPNDYWPISSWAVGAMIGPMIFLPLLENFGLRYGYLILYFLSLLFLVPSAVAQNFATLVVTRFFLGAVVGGVLNATENVIQDVWMTDSERYIPVVIFVYFYIVGVTLGPVFGAIAGSLSWRWISYIQLIIYGAIFPIHCVFVCETRGHVIRARLVRNGELLCSLKNASGGSAPEEEGGQSLTVAVSEACTDEPSLSTLFYGAIVRPFQLLFTEPVVMFFTLWCGLSYGLVFISTQSIPIVFTTNYSFTTPQNGLLQLSLAIGETIGFLICLPQNAYYLRSAKRNTESPGLPIPEARLTASIPASLFGLAGGLFWYAFASTPAVPWPVPAAGLVFVGMGISIITVAIVTYMNDCYGIYSASVVAGLAFGENILSATVPLSTKRMYDSLGMRWGGAVLGFIALAVTVAPLVLWAGGGRWVRARSKFMKKAAEAAKGEAGM